MSDPAAKPLPDNAEQLLATGQLFHTLAADPRYRKKVLGLIKESSPGTIIPELDVEIDMDRRVTERVKPFEDANKTLTERVSSLETRLGREAMREQHGLTEDELVEVETFAKDNGIIKGEPAVKFWRHEQTLGTPRGTRVDAGLTPEDRKLLTKNPKQWALKQADRVIREIRGGRR